MTLTDAALAAELAVEAGKLLLAVRDEVGFAQPWHLGDAGDGRANRLILDALRDARPDDAVLSEESPDNLARLHADRVWIVDPLDGTREFTTPGRDDWAVHIALWQRDSDGSGAITDAAVSLPARGNVVFRSDTVASDHTHTATPSPIRVAVSANRMPAVVRLIREVVPVEPVLMGSAGAKAMAVVRGDVDAYLHAGGQWEWDSAAPAGVVQAAGLHATRLDGAPLRYNRPDPYLPDLLMCRPDVAPTLLDAVRRTLL
ncbi:3'(2'),5'-bisphosphate nucleotidase CysQ [[Mycobacterium] crassicus]|uniref:3'(2'),5-bisphosphonucleoside 3'(2')-phosphohydrolase n=1 Tax=[Mycobacterium] crassicus TaxID=2872309 RepID=A0ABU5XP35_9MYCO|nr:inositol monophosphatase family protein [Mycolicibacter sp. MYC098]MEB3023979.1 inositol monophosphatase family protein [Mycolicibacter sp. MYC098]